ncbi:MAG: acyl-CoA thioesterase [Solirubrobacteraceae bacterium]
MAEPLSGGASVDSGGSSVAEQPGASPTKFDRDTAVWREDGTDRSEIERQTVFGAEVAPDWRAGRGPHGGYLAAMLLRALIESVADDARAPRSLTIHYARAPEPGPARISTVLERHGRSLSTLSARMHQDGELIALVLAAFSVPWGGPELSDAQMPKVDPPDPSREGVRLIERGGPEFARHIVLQPRMEGRPFADAEQPMEIRGWLGLAEPRPIDALSLAFFSDALIPAPYMRLGEPAAVPTIDLTVHFRTQMPRELEPDPAELCLASVRTESIHEGFFVEDGTIWATDGTLLAQSRQLAIVIPFPKR